jgi:hypothetical protein
MAGSDPVLAPCSAEVLSSFTSHFHARRLGEQRCDCGLQLPLSFPSSLNSHRLIREANAQLLGRPELTQARAPLQENSVAAI